MLKLLFTVYNLFTPPPPILFSNLLSVRVDSLYSVPEAWLPVSTPGHKFELALAVPSAEELGTTLLLNNGCLRNPPSKVCVVVHTRKNVAILTNQYRFKRGYIVLVYRFLAVCISDPLQLTHTTLRCSIPFACTESGC